MSRGIHTAHSQTRFPFCQMETARIKQMHTLMETPTAVNHLRASHSLLTRCLSILLSTAPFNEATKTCLCYRQFYRTVRPTLSAHFIKSSSLPRWLGAFIALISRVIFILLIFISEDFIVRRHSQVIVLFDQEFDLWGNEQKWFPRGFHICSKSKNKKSSLINKMF